MILLSPHPPGRNTYSEIIVSVYTAPPCAQDTPGGAIPASDGLSLDSHCVTPRLRTVLLDRTARTRGGEFLGVGLDQSGQIGDW